MCQVCALIIERLIFKGKVSNSEVLQAQFDILAEARSTADAMLNNLTDEEIKTVMMESGRGEIH